MAPEETRNKRKKTRKARKNTREEEEKRGGWKETHILLVCLEWIGGYDLYV